MSKFIDTMKLNINNSNSVLAFETTGGDNWDKWDRYLTIEGKKAYHIGNVCGTCGFFFERLDGANRSISPKEVSSQLRDGISRLDNELISKISKIIPNEDYYANLIELTPLIVIIGGEDDYFANEQVSIWGMDSFWGFPHHPKIRYYRGATSNIDESKVLYEFIVPMFPQGWLDDDTLNEFKNLISNGNKPTALALSVLDIKQQYDSNIEHWCLTHYLIDGHHKTNVANILQKPITIISFLAINQGVSNIDNIDLLINKLNDSKYK